jgi:hypothetical protein
MEVRIAYKLSSTCHPRDLWQVFQTIEDWKKWAGDLFGEAGWVHGEPWEQGSRFCIELLYPQRFDLEVLVLKSNAPFEVALLSHGAGLAAEQWIHFSENEKGGTDILNDEAVVGPAVMDIQKTKQALNTFYDRWFEALRVEAEKHCAAYAL